MGRMTKGLCPYLENGIPRNRFRTNEVRVLLQSAEPFDSAC